MYNCCRYGYMYALVAFCWCVIMSFVYEVSCSGDGGGGGGMSDVFTLRCVN